MGLPRILLLSLGGTITMTRSAAGGITPTLGAADLVAAVPQLDALARLETASPMTLPSASLTLDDVLAVAARIEARLNDDIDGVVVIQGTDTIEETAFVFDVVVRSARPVVVTGAMRGPQSAGADGPANLLAATLVAASPQAHGLGTLVVLNDQIHAARHVQKSHTALPSSFASPLVGPLGLVAEGRPRVYLRPPARLPALAPPAGADAPVALLRMSLGDDGRMLRALEGLGCRGLVLEGMGAGHVPAAVAPIVGEVAARMPVVLASRVASGPAFCSTYGYPGSEIDLLGRGAISAGALAPLKARLLLSLALRGGADRSTVASIFAAYA